MMEKGFTGLIASALLLGCIENPGPDRELGAKKSKFSIRVDFRQSGILDLTLREIEGRTHLIVTNLKDVAVDSANLVLWFSYMSGSRPPLDYLSTSTLTSGRVRIGRLGPGATEDFGILESPAVPSSPNRFLNGTLTGLWISGEEYSHPLSGLYKGSSREYLKSGKTVEWPLRGIINADGTAVFAFRDGPTPGYGYFDFYGRVQPDGSVTDIIAGFSETMEVHPGPGRFEAAETGYRLAVANPDTAVASDSLVLSLKPLGIGDLL